MFKDSRKGSKQLASIIVYCTRGGISGATESNLAPDTNALALVGSKLAVKIKI